LIIGEFTAGVRILLEKGLSRYNISKGQQFQENTQMFLFCQKTEVARRRGRGEPPGAHTTPWRGLALGCAARWCGYPGPLLPASLRQYRLPENLRHGGVAKRLRHLCEAENTHRERKLSGRQKSTGEIPSRRGEIIAIVTVIELGFIRIIIITIATSTFITIITMPSRCNILG
jgi:hypothetical protein